jgi:PAS domain S-box-containing protein
METEHESPGRPTPGSDRDAGTSGQPGDDGDGEVRAAGSRGEHDLGAEAYRAVFEAAPDGILIVDHGGRIRDLNRQAEELFGYGREELLGEEVERLVPEMQREAHRRHREEYTDDPESRPMGVGLSLEGRRRDGSTFPVEISLSPMEQGGELLVVAAVRDVTRQRRLRDFGLGAVKAAEEERQRIARELHDDVAQRVATLVVRLRVAERTSDPERRTELFEELREEMVEATEAIRRVARGLRPPALQDVGLTTAIRSHVRSRVEHEELEVEISADPLGSEMDEDRQLAIYRIVQEALTNVIRHADARTARVIVRRRDGAVSAEVVDDGRGFEWPAPLSRLDGGLGLLGMQERAHAVGGEVEIESEPGSGTRVRARVPMMSEETPHV